MSDTGESDLMSFASHIETERRIRAAEFRGKGAAMVESSYRGEFSDSKKFNKPEGRGGGKAGEGAGEIKFYCWKEGKTGTVTLAMTSGFAELET